MFFLKNFFFSFCFLHKFYFLDIASVLENEFESEQMDFREIMDVIYETKPPTIIYSKDKKNQAFLNNNNKDVIYESEIPTIIKKNSLEGFKEMNEGNFKPAILAFKKSENLINVHLKNYIILLFS